MRLAVSPVTLDLFAWWCERYAVNTGLPYSTGAKARDEHLLKQAALDTRLPVHQMMLAIDRWQQTSNGSILVFTAALPRELARLTDPNDSIAIARVYLIASLSERQRRHVEALARLVAEYDDLTVAWDASVGNPDAVIPVIDRVLVVMERDA